MNSAVRNCIIAAFAAAILLAGPRHGYAQG